MKANPVLDDADGGAAVMRGAPFGRRRPHSYLAVAITLLVATAGLFASSPTAAAATASEVGASRLLVGTWKIWWSDDVTATFVDGSPVSVVPQSYCEATPNLYREITAIDLWSYQMRQYPCDPAYSGSSPGKFSLAAEGNELRLSAAIDGAGTAVLWLRTHPGYACAGGALTVEQAMKLANAAWESGASLELVDSILEDPCAATLEAGDPVATTGTPYQYSEPVAGGGARVWTCDTFDVTWPIKFTIGNGFYDEIGVVSTSTSACSDGSTVKGGNPATNDPPVASPAMVSMEEPFSTLYDHSPVGGPTFMPLDNATKWRYRQVLKYQFMAWPVGGADIEYRFTLVPNPVQGTPPIVVGQYPL